MDNRLQDLPRALANANVSFTLAFANTNVSFTLAFANANVNDTLVLANANVNDTLALAKARGRSWSLLSMFLLKQKSQTVHKLCLYSFI